MFPKHITVLIAFLFFTSINSYSQSESNASILTIGGEPVSKSEFERVYKKNNIKEISFDSKSVNDYLQLYINYKLKVKEAFELGMDTAKNFVEELAGYRKQLAQPYLTDKQVTDALIREAYDRMKTDVRASHILVKVAQDAIPKDTIDSYNKALKIREEILKGAEFGSVAKAKSDDPSAKENNGDLGFFTSLQMVYPFENAVYTTKVNELTMPVRTRFGYHIIKVTDSRPAQGEVKVAHVMVKFGSGGKAEDTTNALSKINEINDKVKAGENFETLARQFSEDQGTAKNGGVLPMFGTGRMVPEFERAAFGLKNVGDVSGPVKTSYGYHLIKLMEKKPLGTFDELQADIKNKVSKDSRSELSKTSMQNKIKSKYGFKEFPKALDEFMKVVDTSLVNGNWNAERTAKLNNVLFTLDNKNYSQKDFASYVEKHQSKRSTGEKYQSLINKFYNDWVNESCLNYEESRLDMIYPEFKALMTEYHDGILLFELTDKKVWSKAVKDTTGLKEFYESNKSNYMWPERLDAVIYTCANATVAKEVRKQMKKITDPDTLLARINKDSQLNLQIKSGKFVKGENEIIDGLTWQPGLSKDIVKDNQVVFVDVKNQLAIQNKTIDEAKGIITADYQNYLEKEWIASLKEKFPVVIHQDVVDSMIK